MTRRQKTGAEMTGFANSALSSLAGIALASAAFAGPLPPTAKPMSADAIAKIYSGHTAVFNISDIYFAPDGTTKGLFGKPKIKGTFAGKWSVNGNEICTSSGGTDKSDPKIYTDCWKWFGDGKKTYALWSTHYDGSAVDEANGYNDKEIKNYRPGDRVSKRYAAMGGT